MMRTKTRMLGLDVTTTIVADGFTTGVLDLTKSQADVENSFASTVEPVYPDPGKCGHLYKADIKPWSRIAFHLPTLSTHLQFTDTSIF